MTSSALHFRLTNVIFKTYSASVKTNRDAWAYNFNFLHKLPCFCPISVGTHIVSDEAQTHAPIKKITPKNFYTPLRRKDTKNTIFIAFYSTKDALKKVDAQL